MVVAPSRLDCRLPGIVALERVRIFQAEIHRHRHARTLPVETAPALARIPQRGEVLEHLVRRCRVMAHRRTQHGPLRFHREIFDPIETGPGAFYDPSYEKPRVGKTD